MYRKIPVDLMEGSRSGSVLSYVVTLAMLSLFLFETRAYFEKTYVLTKCIDPIVDSYAMGGLVPSSLSLSIVSLTHTHTPTRNDCLLTHRIVTDLALDSNKDPRVRLK